MLRIDPTLASGSPARPSDRSQIEGLSLRDESITPPSMSQTSKGKTPKRVKISAKAASLSTEARRKKKVVKPVHTFISSRSKFAYCLGKIQALSRVSEPLELLEPEPNQIP
ncbi:unnamed protein product [Cochlearia groenlandica]